MNTLPILSSSYLKWRSPLPETDSTTRIIPLTQGKVAIIDAVDFERVSKHKWHHHAANRTNTKSYARARINGKMIFLHQFILAVPPDKITDHRNRDGLDCRRANMRACTRSQNACNVAVRGGRFTVMLRIKDPSVPRGQRDYYGGTYDSPEDAARAHDVLALRIHGEFAGLNFPEDERLAKSQSLELRPYNRIGVTLDGQTKRLTEWANEFRVPIECVRARLARGWSLRSALAAPTGRVERAASCMRCAARFTTDIPNKTYCSDTCRSKAGSARGYEKRKSRCHK
jgi:hypothetical protein